MLLHRAILQFLVGSLSTEELLCCDALYLVKPIDMMHNHPDVILC